MRNVNKSYKQNLRISQVIFTANWFLLDFRYQFFLQLKQDLLQERLECGYETAVQLSAYCLQCKFFGDIHKPSGPKSVFNGIKMFWKFKKGCALNQSLRFFYCCDSALFCYCWVHVTLEIVSTWFMNNCHKNHSVLFMGTSFNSF